MSHLHRLLAPAHAQPRKAALLLAVAAFLVLAGPTHLALEALHAGEFAHGPEAAAHDSHEAVADAVSRIEAACPGDCEAPGHHHRGHDHGSCTACRAFAAAGLQATPIFSQAATASRVAAALPPARPRQRSLSPDAPRGPPVTALAVA